MISEKRVIETSTRSFDELAAHSMNSFHKSADRKVISLKHTTVTNETLRVEIELETFYRQGLKVKGGMRARGNDSEYIFPRNSILNDMALWTLRISAL